MKLQEFRQCGISARRNRLTHGTEARAWKQSSRHRRTTFKTKMKWEGGVFSVNGAGPIQHSHEKKHVSTPTSHYTQKSTPDYLQS